MVRRTLNRGGYRVGNRTINKRRKNSKNMRGGGDEQDRRSDRSAADVIALMKAKKAQEAQPAQAEAQAEPAQAQAQLFEAIKKNDLEIVRQLVDSHPTLLKEATINGSKAVGYAVQKIVLGNLDASTTLGNVDASTTLDMVNLLCELGADVNDRANDEVDTPLHVAVIESELTEVLVELLLYYKANPYLKNIDDLTALEVSKNPKVRGMIQAAMSAVSPPQPAAGAVGDSTAVEFVNGETIEFARPYQMAKQMQEDMVNYIGRGYDFKKYWERNYPNTPGGQNLLDMLGFGTVDMGQEDKAGLTSRVSENIKDMWKLLEDKNSPIKFARDEHHLETDGNYLPIAVHRLKMNADEEPSQGQIEALMGQMEAISIEDEGKEQDLEKIQAVKRNHNMILKNSMREALEGNLNFNQWLHKYNLDDWERRQEPGWEVNDPYIPLWGQVLQERKDRGELARDEFRVVFNGKPSKWGLVLDAFGFDDRPTIHGNIPTKYLKVSKVQQNTQAHEQNSRRRLVGLVVKSVNGEEMVGGTAAELVQIINEASTDNTTIVFGSDPTDDPLLFAAPNFTVNFVGETMGIDIQSKDKDGNDCEGDEPAAYLEVLEVKENGEAASHNVNVGQVIRAINYSEFREGTTINDVKPVLGNRPVAVTFGPKPDI